MNTLMPLDAASTSMSASNWLQSSVQVFFSSLNWDDLSPDVQPVGQAMSQYSDAPLSLDLSVHHFFAAINWDGATIAAPVAAPAQPVSASSFTLDDFSGLFG
jgi:hypothetical protein